ncbi:OstA-like protein [Blattabacterium cuenoti]|uniref:OstA-like protein n=1 Tax=Blattabacterium cuenoti TaxID=1653831 RepID=UPI001CC22166|nr:OstA-like protein [Blattabacterium cuenoti]
MIIKSIIKYYFLFFFFILFINQGYSKNIELIHADLIQKNDHNDAIFLKGNVFIKYDKYHLFCKNAIYYKKNNKFYGYGNVKFQLGNNKIFSKKIYIENNFSYFKLSDEVILNIEKKKLKLTSDIINYDLKKKSLQAINNVVLIFNKLKLTTNMLEYNLNINKIFYRKNSIIYYNNYVIHSKEGSFFPKKDKVELKNEIKLISNDYTIYTNILEYFFKQNKIIFKNYSVIVQNNKINNFIYVKEASFFIKKKFFFFEKEFSIYYNEKIIKGEYLFFNQKKKYGFIKNFLLEDLKNKYFLIGGYGKFDFNNNSLILKKNPIIINISKKNSFIIDSNILKINFKENYEYFIQAFSVKSFFLNESIQGRCHILNYESSNDYIRFNGNPIFWFQNNQITGESIYIYLLKKNEFFLKNIKIIKNAFYIEKINSKEFNQVKSDIITGFFDNDENNKNTLKKILFEGNINSIIFIHDNKEKKLINKSSCKRLSLLLDNEKKISNIYCIEQAYSELIPFNQKTPNKFIFLSNFFWKEKPKKNKNFFYQKIEKYKKKILLEKEKIKKIIKK